MSRLASPPESVATLRLELPSLAELDRLASGPLAPGIPPGAPSRTVFHDVYFDTADGALERRGAACRVRTFEDGRRVIGLEMYRLSEGLAGTPVEVIEESVAARDRSRPLDADTEPGRRLRLLTDPALLCPRLELRIERRSRQHVRGVWRRVTAEFAFDTVTVRAAGRERSFADASIRMFDSAELDADRMLVFWQTHAGASRASVTTLARARQIDEVLQLEGRARALGVGRAVVVTFHVGDELGCLLDSGGARLPSRAGSGRDVALGLAREVLPASADGVRRLGFAPASAGRPLLEVWLADAAASVANPSLAERGGLSLTWLPTSWLAAHAGSAALLDPTTLAALGVILGADGRMRWHSRAATKPVAADWPAAPRPPFLNADLSILDFAGRVLELAEDVGTPTLERLRFLAIACANLDEFFMVRVAALRGDTGALLEEGPEDGMSRRERLDSARLRSIALADRQARCFAECVDELARVGVHVRRWEELSPDQREAMRVQFDEDLQPRLHISSVTLAPGHPFPRLPHLTLSLAVVGRDRHTGTWQLSQLDLPKGVPRFVPLADTRDVIALEEIARAFAPTLYPDLEIDAVYAFRLTRAGDLEIDTDDHESLLHRIEEATRRRGFNAVTRVEVERAMPAAVRHALLQELLVEPGVGENRLRRDDVYEIDGLLNLADARELAALAATDDEPAAQYPPFTGRATVVSDQPLWPQLLEGDRLAHHPYESWDGIVRRFFDEAADDPAVEAIFTTLYRTGDESPVVDALLRARSVGKAVVACVELKARFDEERNISWAKTLERVGARVVYGRAALKNHAKVAVIERREGDVVRRYAHIGSGNYNARTARAYTDLSLLTADETVAGDLRRLFDWFTSGDENPPREFDRCLVSPTVLLPALLERIERELRHARAGRSSRIRLKLNGLSDPELVANLYRASQAGVDIDASVRGICTLRPGVPGLSERIRVVSVLGRFLEHARIYHFANGGDDEYFIGSADWRPRNLRRRIEVMVPVVDTRSRAQLGTILDLDMRDATAWELGPQGVYTRRGSHGRGAQEVLRQAMTEISSRADDIAPVGTAGNADRNEQENTG